jgi:hypothetical protein
MIANLDTELLRELVELARKLKVDRAGVPSIPSQATPVDKVRPGIIKNTPNPLKSLGYVRKACLIDSYNWVPVKPGLQWVAATTGRGGAYGSSRRGLTTKPHRMFYQLYQRLSTLFLTECQTGWKEAYARMPPRATVMPEPTQRSGFTTRDGDAMNRNDRTVGS